MRQLLTLFILITATLYAALPTTDEVKKAIAAKEYHKAEAMVREVIAARPTSAKAHYYLAQILAYEAKFAEAQNALNDAKRLDPSLKFGDMEKIAALEAKLAQAAGSTVTTPAPAAVPTEEKGLPWGWIAVGLGLLALVIMAASRRPKAQNYGADGMPTSAPAQSGYPSSGSGLGGALMGGLAAGAGAAAGMALANSFLHQSEAHAEEYPKPDEKSLPNDLFGSNDFDMSSGDWDGDSSGGEW